MNLASPLRYPGGKGAMAGVLAQIRRLNGLGGRAVVEPFAGGAGASLKLLFMEETGSVHLNDADPAVHDFWWAVTHQTEKFLDLLNQTPVNIDEWRRQRAIYRDAEKVSRMARGFAAFYLNRCNRSGIIINGGPIGGIDQSGKWKLDARFNKVSLRQRCQAVAEYRERITVTCLDGVEAIRRTEDGQAFLFVDPPYFHKGKLLYLNSLSVDYHRTLAETLHERRDTSWVLTYDDCDEVRRLYEGWATVRPFSLRYAAAERRQGREVLIVPTGMKLPDEQSSDAIVW